MGGSGIGLGSSLTKEQKGISQALGQWLQPLIGQPGEAWGPTGPWQAGEPFAYTAPMSALEQQARTQAGQAMGAQPTYTSALQQALGGMDPAESERRFRELIQPAMERTYTQEVAPRITESYVGPGLVHSAERGRGEAEGAQRFGEQVNVQLAESIRRGQEQAYQAIPMETQRQGQQQLMPMQLAQMGGEMGALPRALQQQEMMSRLQEFIRTRPEASQIIQQALSYIGTPMQFGVGEQDPLMSILGSLIGGGAGGGTGGLFGSVQKGPSLGMPF